MAITREWQAGAEVDTTNSDNIEFDVVGASWDVTAVDKKTGSYAFTTGTNDYGYATKNIAASRQYRGAFHWKVGDPQIADMDVFGLLSGAGAGIANVKYLDAAGTGLYLYVNGASRDTAAAIFSPGDWVLLGFDFKIDAVAGWTKVYLDGVEILSFAGNTGNVDMEKIVFGQNHDDWVSPASLYDDIYLDDATGEEAAVVPPDLRFEHIIPDGNGNYSQLDGSDGNQVDNYLQVDERPNDGDTTYNKADAADEKDSYAMTTHLLGAGWAVNAVIPCAIVRKTDGGVASQFAPMLRENGVDWEGTAQDLSTSYALIWERRTTDPGGAAWDQASLDAVEVGVWAEGAFA